MAFAKECERSLRTVDSNVLVRLLARDDAAQAKRAEEFVSRGAWVSHLVLAETVWVLESVYDRTPKAIAKAVAMLLEHEVLVLQEPEIVRDALHVFVSRRAVTFTDCLILETARKAGHTPLGTFDKALSRLPDTQVP